MAVEGAAVTVVVPVHRGGALALEAIESLLAQTYPAVEVLVVNDGSPDPRDRDLATAFGDRIRYVEHENRGLPATLNRALFELVDTPLVAVLHADDIADPERIQEQVSLLEEVGADACLSRFWRVGPTGRRLSIHPSDERAWFDYDPDRFGQIVHSTLLARTAFVRGVGGYDPELFPADDWDLSMRLHEAGRVVVYGRPLVDYRIHEGANTFAYAAEMELKARYVAERDGDSPPYAEWAERHPLTRADRRRVRARVWYRKGGVAAGTSHWLRAGALVAGAFVLAPGQTRRRLRQVRLG